MILAYLAVPVGLAVLMWGANRFVDGSASVAHHFRMPPLLIGMLIVGFGTSAPEIVVAAISAAQGNPGIALGNAYGSNITNIALILGLSAVIYPIVVDSVVLRKELPILTGVTGLTAIQLLDGEISRLDAMLLLGVFALFIGWSLWQGMRNREDPFAKEVDQEVSSHSTSLGRSLVLLLLGLLLLVASSRLLVWGAVEIARDLAVSDLIIGLTVVAVGTSLPELASAIIAARKRQHDLALGNVLGSNLFNTLAVVGVAGVISPLPADPSILKRDVLVMTALTVALFVIGYGFRGQGRVNRFEGWVLFGCYLAYTAYLVI
jgi:cation:H+ antiporter